MNHSAQRVWNMSEDKRRAYFARRAAAGAKRSRITRDLIDLGSSGPALDKRQVATLSLALNPSLPVWKRILFETAIKHQIAPDVIVGEQRRQSIVRARHELMYRLSAETPMSLQMIARRIGQASHAGVIYGIRRHLERAGVQA